MNIIHLKGPGRYDFHIYDHTGDKDVLEKLNFIIEQNKTIMDNQKDAAAEVKAVTEQLKKVGVESAKTLQKIADLEAVVANLPKVDPELADAIAELKSQAKIVDDMVPDPPVEETPA